MANYSLNPTFDTHIRSDNTSTNYKTQTSIGIGEPNNNTFIYRALLKFDLSGVGAGEVATGTPTLYLYRASDLSSNARRFNVYRVKQTLTTDATWNTYDGSNNWGTAGCADTTNDRDATAFGYRDMSGAETADQECAFPLDLTLFNAWLSGSFTNNGIAIIAETESDDAILFRSVDYATDATKRPKLVFDTEIAAGGQPMQRRGILVPFMRRRPHGIN